MDQGGFNGIFNLITLGYGLYAVYTWFRLLREPLFSNPLLIPKERAPKDCLEPETYVAYIRPRTLVLGVIAALSGGIGLLGEGMGFLAAAAAAIGMDLLPFELLYLVALPLAVVIWYAVCVVRAQKKYFP